MSFSFVGGLKKHIQVVHNNMRNLVECDLCQKSLSKDSMKKHIQVVHNNMKNLVECDLCQKSLSKDSMKRHKAMHRRIFIKALRVDG